MANLAHQLFPTLTERLSGKTAEAQIEKAEAIPHTTGFPVPTDNTQHQRRQRRP